MGFSDISGKEVGSDAATGAMVGGAVGTAVPVIGNAAGALIGGAAGGLYGLGKGLFSSSPQKPAEYQDRNQLMRYINNGMSPGGIANQQAPQLQMGSDPFRQGQLQQMQQLQGIASGQQQGAAELAAQRQIQNALAAQQAQARAARGGNGAMAYRNAADQSAALGISGAGMGQQAALQDQMNAQGLLGQVNSAGRTGDYNTANANAGYQQANNERNSQNYLGLMQQLGNMDATTLTGQNAANTANAQQNAAITGGALSAGGQILSAYLQNKK